ncbi:acyltransferase family protein [Janthinobacterium agaricidamnosum]|uniref:Acyltransferase family protein n=1 Tax=Janthinobacterium agaricidamnosum NBRC 102515 = DSM 9628 TaxID=1349767 RepID=W0V3U3_9BURK|nr:acyltransferase [Janthinobacterium agaricidamnosum]CDG83489.1 acyltransferase family protein [Janthinobacterium agaricidamnosum NBRC 102515 = DSM 9628]
MTHQTPTPRLYGLDTLRALAIVLVFMNHYLLFVSDGAAFGFWGEIGWTGVDLFFALSGYLIGNQILAALRSERGFSLRHFYARRFLRTLPNFYVVLALYYLWPAFRGSSELLPVWKFLTFTQNINLTPGTAFSHAWSLCVEEQFYVLLPAVALLIAACRKSRLWAWVAVAASIVAGMLVRSYLWNEYVHVPRGGLGYYKYIYYASWCRFDELVAGVALALLKNHHAAAWSRFTAYGNRTLLAGLAGTALMFYLFLNGHYGYWMTVLGYPALALSFSLLLVSALSPDSMLQKLRVPGAASLALWSYAIYLTHKQLCILLRPLLLERGYGPDSVPAILLMIAVSIVAGWLLYKLVETPFMLLRDRFVPSNHALPA